MNKYLSSLLGLLLAACVSMPAMAQDEDSGDDSDSSDAPPSPLEGRPYYFSPMASYLMADSDRGTGDGYGVTLALGKKMTYGLNLEVSGYFLKAGSNPPAGTADNGSLSLSGLALTAMLFPLQSFPEVYALFSVGRGRDENMPGAIPDAPSTVFDSGVGYLYPITQRLILRVEARYHMDSTNKDKAGVQPKDNTDFYDGVFNAGLLIPLGPLENHTLPPAEEAPTEVASTAATDSDNDGVPDDADTCPDTPAGAQVDEKGCEPDADADGVPDRLDLCADTPAGTAVGATGCANDADGDGVLDNLDECPQTPAGSKVLANGCALKGDCRTPRPGEQVDESGCAAGQAFILKGVVFEYDSTRLTEDAKGILNGVAETLKAYPEVNVEIAGHTDNSGSDSYNLGLSERRSIAVKDYLTAHDVNAARMTPVGYGESQPIDSNDTDSGRINNRRVELRVIEEGGAAPAATPSADTAAPAEGAAPDAGAADAGDAAAEAAAGAPVQ